MLTRCTGFDDVRGYCSSNDYNYEVVVIIRQNGYMSAKVLHIEIWNKIRERIDKCCSVAVEFTIEVKDTREKVHAFRELFNDDEYHSNDDLFEILDRLLFEEELNIIEKEDEKNDKEQKFFKNKKIVLGPKILKNGSKVYVMKDSVQFIIEPNKKEIVGIYQPDKTIRKLLTLEEKHIAQNYSLSLSSELIEEEDKQKGVNELVQQTVRALSPDLTSNINNTLPKEEYSKDLQRLNFFTEYVYTTYHGFDLDKYLDNVEDLEELKDNIKNIDDVNVDVENVQSYLQIIVNSSTEFSKVVLKHGKERPYILKHKDITYYDILEATRVFSLGRNISGFEFVSYNRGSMELKVEFHPN